MGMSQMASFKIDEIVTQAITNKWKLVLVVDDYTSVHSIRRTKTDTLSNAKYMCTMKKK